MKVLVWQWGRYGAGPRYAHELSRAFSTNMDTEVLLSLSRGSELLQTREVTDCAVPMPTYTTMVGLVGRIATAPVVIPPLARTLRLLNIDIAVCAMPAAMDFVMAAALKLARIPYVVVVHEADPHPGDPFPSQLVLQRWLVRGAIAVFALSSFVADRLREQDWLGGRRLLLTSLPPLFGGTEMSLPGRHEGQLRLLSFGRLLPYKGLDLLTESLGLLGKRADLAVRVVGSGPESPALARLRELAGVTVENAWVPEREVVGVLGWADALILPYREASQSGVAAAAIATGRWIISTRVGGLPEQLAGYSRAILCEPTAPDLADALRKLLDMADLSAPLVANGPPDWNTVASEMLDDLRGLTVA